MQYSTGYFFTDETEPQDDIDKLFSQLQPVELPMGLISRILFSVSLLFQAFPAINTDGMVVWNEEKEPS